MADFSTEKLIAFLNQKWKDKPCPMCGEGPWNVQGKAFQLMEFHSGNVVIGGPVVPVIPVTCGNCGNTVLVNAIISGAVERPPPAESKSAEPTPPESKK